MQIHVTHPLAKAIFRGIHFVLFRAALYRQMPQWSHGTQRFWTHKVSTDCSLIRKAVTIPIPSPQELSRLNSVTMKLRTGEQHLAKVFGG